MVGRVAAGARGEQHAFHPAGAPPSAEQDPTGLSQLSDSLGGLAVLAAVIGMCVAEAVAEGLLDYLPRGHRRPRLLPRSRISSAHRTGSPMDVAE